MSATIFVGLTLAYGGSDDAEYDAVMEDARRDVAAVGDDLAGEYEAVRVVDVQVSG